MLNKLQTIQNKSLKIVYRRKSDLSLDEMHKQAKLLKLEDRRKLNQLKVAYKMNKIGYLNPFLDENKSEGSMRLRSYSQQLLYMYPERSKFAKDDNTFFNNSIRLWNTLPLTFKSTETFQIFCIRTKREMLQCKLNFPE